MGFVFITEPETEIKVSSSRVCAVSRRKTLKRLTAANRRYLISLGFKVKENK